MGYVLTGYERTLKVEITKLINGEVQPGYPKTYDGKSDVDFLIAYPQYSGITNEELARLSLLDFNSRVSDFKTWIELAEVGFILDTTDMRQTSESCVETTTTTTYGPTTTTTTYSPTTTTTTYGPTTTTTTYGPTTTTTR